MRQGRVVLVGAGPGGPGLLTIAALDALRAADVVLYDRLAGPAFRRYVRPRTVLVDVGKRPGAKATTQEEISLRLVTEAKAGRTVVRMKGGDPFVFGRGYEEVVACLEAGVAVEVVPGVSSALAAPELAGVPLTNRGFPPAFTVVSGHEDPAKGRPAVDWSGLVGLGGPLVVLMGVGTFAAHAAVLMGAGMDPATPVAAVEWATTRRQRVVRTRLGNAADTFSAAALASPAVIVVGANVALADAVGEIEVSPSVSGAAGGGPAPLAGWRIVVPLSRGGGSELAALLRARGADVAELVVARFDPLPAADAASLVASLRAREVGLVVCTSALGAEGLVAALTDGGGDTRLLAGTLLLAASGAARAGLGRFGLVPDAAAVGEVPPGDGLAVVAAVAGGDAAVVAEVEAAGWSATRLDVARAADVAPGAGDRAVVAAADAVVFPSSGTAAAWGRMGLARPPVVACIGPSTAAAAAEAGCEADVVPADAGLDALVAALCEFATGR